jgi:hypothetical protein
VKWVDRKFDFDFPVSESAELVKRLRGAPDELEAAQRDQLRNQILAKHGARNELISTPSPTKKGPSRPGKKHGKRKRR